jgi:uncharacterized membrane protein
MLSLLTSIISFVLLDVCYVSAVKAYYVKMIARIQGGKPMKINKIFMILSYTVLLFTLTFIIIPYAVKMKKSNEAFSNVYVAFSAGALIGFSIYGIFNTTNLAMFKDYSVSLALVDTIWGTFLFFISTYIYLKMSSNNLHY